MLPFDFSRYSHVLIIHRLLVPVCVSVGQRAFNGSPYMMVLHNRGFFCPLHTSPTGQGCPHRPPSLTPCKGTLEIWYQWEGCSGLLQETCQITQDERNREKSVYRVVFI